LSAVVPPNVAASEPLAAPFVGSDAVACGLLTPEQLRGKRWRRVLRDVYVPRELPDSPRLRAAAVALVLPPGAAVSGRSAVWVHGGDVLRRGEALEVTVSREAWYLRRPGLVVRQAALPDDECELVDGLLVTTPARTAFDLARRPAPGDRQQLTRAVVALDALAHLGCVRMPEVQALADRHPGWRGIRRIGAVLALVEPRAESPMETTLRLVLVFGGLPRPEAQIEVVDRWGFVVGRIDMGYPAALLGIEYDGSVHGRGRKRADDRRANLLREYGWTLLRYGDEDVLRYPTMIVQQVGRLLVRAS
jgi:AbiEi antitoxin C-terminal domain/Protein of unknown function (DUF559)